MDTGSYPLYASEWQNWPLVMRDIAMQSVDKCAHLCQETKGDDCNSVSMIGQR